MRPAEVGSLPGTRRGNSRETTAKALLKSLPKIGFESAQSRPGNRLNVGALSMHFPILNWENIFIFFFVQGSFQCYY